MASGGGDWKDFYAAAERGDLACVRYHLSCGVDINYQHPEVMQSALFVSVLQGHQHIARVLLENGADPNLAAELGPTTPLQAAIRTRNWEMKKLLQQFGATDTAAHEPRSWWQRWLAL